MQPNTLYDYYKSKGQALPSIQDRTSIATQAGISGYTGTAEQNTKLLSYLQKGNLPATTPPTNAGAVTTPTPDVQIPTGTPSAGNVSNVSAAMKGLTTFYETKAAEDKATAEAAQKAIENQQNSPEAKASSSYLQKLLGSKSVEQARTEATQATGINPANFFAQEKAKIAEIEQLTTEYNSLKAAKDAQIAQSYDKFASTSFINNQIAQIERNAAPRLNELSSNINSKAAVLTALQGSFQDAQKYIDQAVQDATADLKFNYDMFQAFNDVNETAISKLDKKYQSALEDSRDNAEKAWTTAVEEKNLIGKLMLDNPQAGISLSDSIETAYRKAGISSGKGTTSSTNFLDVMQSAIDEGASPEEAARAAASVSESLGIQVDQKTLQSYTDTARRLSPTVVTTTEQQLPQSQIEREIAELQKIKGYKKLNIQKALERRGYSSSDISNSSIGSFSTRAESFFSNLFGS